MKVLRNTILALLLLPGLAFGSDLSNYVEIGNVTELNNTVNLNNVRELGPFSDIRSLFAGAGEVGVYAYNPDSSAQNWLKLIRKVTANKYFSAVLRYGITPTGDYIHALRGMDVDIALLSTDVDDATITKTGTWISGANASAYSGNYLFSNTTNDYIEWETSGSTSAVGVRCLNITNAGIALVTIDGDTTRANNLSTAQDLVNAGELDAAALVGNGGTLNPTDRVINQYLLGASYDEKIVFADDLDLTQHTIRVSVTGYKQAASSDDRVYITGAIYADGSVSLADHSSSAFLLLTKTTLLGVANTSAWEYAIRATPSGATADEYIGGHAHGNEQQLGLSVYVDGALVSLSAGEIASGSTATVFRDTQFLHSEIAAGGAAIAAATTRFGVSRSGLTVNADITWAQNTVFQQTFSHMWPIGTLFNTCKNISGGVAETLSDNDGSYKANAKSGRVYCWADSGETVALNIPDLNASVLNYQYVPSTPQLAVNDVTGGPYEKIYATRYTSGQGGAVEANETWSLKAEYWFQFLSAAERNRL